MENKEFNLDEVIQVLEGQFNDVTEKPLTIPFEVTDGSMVPAGKEISSIVIKPLMVGTVFQMQPLLLKLEVSELVDMIVKEGKDFSERTPELFAKYAELVLDILCIAINNKKTSGPDWFKEMLRWNCTWKDLHFLFNAVVFRIGQVNFCKSIMVAKSHLSLYSEAEIIALHKNLQKMKESPSALTN